VTRRARPTLAATALTGGSRCAPEPAEASGGRRARFAPSERAVQDAVLRYLALDRRVAWAHRFNTGAHVVDEAAAAKARLLDRYAPG
jgi:hypothetical protein